MRIKSKVKVQQQNENDMYYSLYYRLVQGDVLEKIMEEKSFIIEME